MIGLINGVRKTGASRMLLNPAVKLIITVPQIIYAPIPPAWNRQAHVASTSVHGNRQAQPAWNRQAHVKVLVTAVVRVTPVVAQLWNVGAHVILLRDASEEMTVLNVAFAQMGLTPIPPAWEVQVQLVLVMVPSNSITSRTSHPVLVTNIPILHNMVIGDNYSLNLFTQKILSQINMLQTN